jgi:hypothetical protein
MGELLGVDANIGTRAVALPARGARGARLEAAEGGESDRVAQLVLGPPRDRARVVAQCADEGGLQPLQLELRLLVRELVLPAQLRRSRQSPDCSKAWAMR